MNELFKGCFYYPVISPRPPWITNATYPDCSFAYASNDPHSWADDYRLNIAKQTQALGGDTITYLAEYLYGRTSLTDRLCNALSPGNIVIPARSYGINRWVVTLFDSPNSLILPLADRAQAYVDQMVATYAWATPDQVAYLIGTECNRNMPVSMVAEAACYIRSKCNGKRILVGSALPDFLKACWQADHAIELWLETKWNPVTEEGKANWQEYAKSLEGLMKLAPTWAGEWWCSDPAKSLEMCKEAVAIGIAGFGSGRFK